MPKPAAIDKVHVIVTDRPQKVFVVCNDEIHAARWRTSGNGWLRDVEGNHGLLYAAMLAWGNRAQGVYKDHQTFSLTFAELEEESQGWGAWDD